MSTVVPSLSTSNLKAQSPLRLSSPRATPADAVAADEGENSTTTAGSIGEPSCKPAEKTGTHRQPIPKTLQGIPAKGGTSHHPKMPYPDAVVNLDRWLWRASHSRIDAMKKLYEKMKRNKAGILSTIRLGMSNARIEATNNKIKLLIQTAYGFRNMENMLSLIMLSCSYVEVKIAYKWSAENKESLNKAA